MLPASRSTHVDTQHDRLSFHLCNSPKDSMCCWFALQIAMGWLSPPRDCSRLVPVSHHTRKYRQQERRRPLVHTSRGRMKKTRRLNAFGRPSYTDCASIVLWLLHQSAKENTELQYCANKKRGIGFPATKPSGRFQDELRSSRAKNYGLLMGGKSNYSELLKSLAFIPTLIINIHSLRMASW
jgi:hypothetical protein